MESAGMDKRLERMRLSNKARRDQRRREGVCINSGPSSKVAHGPPVVAGKCAGCVEVHRRSR